MWYQTGVKAARAGALAIVLALAVAATGGAANVKGTTYVDKADGYAITIPSTWQLIPRTKAQVTALIAALKKKKQTVLANFYAGILASKAGLSGINSYRFQAFDWPGSETQPVPVEVSLGVIKGKKAYTARDLPSIGAVFANAFAANKGAKVTVPKTVTLPFGKAEFIEASIPIGSGVQNGAELYLIPHGKTLYELSFQIEASQLKGATLFTSIAQNFKLL
jgi:hypothetical protein